MHPNPYKSPEPIEALWADVIDDTPLPPERAIGRTIAGVTVTIGVLLSAEVIVNDDVGRFGLLAAAIAGLVYSATLSDVKSPSAP